MDISILDQIKEDLQTGIIEKKMQSFTQFFKTGPGEYGEGDTFIGITVPHIRQTVKIYWKYISLEETLILLKNPIHEYRLAALLILVEKFTKTKVDSEKE